MSAAASVAAAEAADCAVVAVLPAEPQAPSAMAAARSPAVVIKNFLFMLLPFLPLLRHGDIVECTGSIPHTDRFPAPYNLCCYPFTAPLNIPRISCFCPTMKMEMEGRMISTTPAIIIVMD